MLTPIGYYRYRLANTEFHWSMDDEPSTAGIFRTRTPPDAMLSLPQLRDRLRFRSILCFSAEDGGDVALVALVGAPRRLVGVLVDRDPGPLEEFARLRGIDDRVRTMVGPPPSAVDVDQLISREFGGEGPEVVIDVVSRGLAAGRAAFERLFPRVRAGGCFVIGGWATAHYAFHDFIAALDPADTAAIADTRKALLAEVLASGDLFEALVPALLRANRDRPDVVASVRASRHWLVVDRGPATLGDSFTLDSMSSP